MGVACAFLAAPRVDPGLQALQVLARDGALDGARLAGALPARVCLPLPLRPVRRHRVVPVLLAGLGAVAAAVADLLLHLLLLLPGRIVSGNFLVTVSLNGGTDTAVALLRHLPHP